MSEQATELEAVYAERNAVVLAFARMAELQGWEVGKLIDPQEPDWPVLMIDTPAGQVSWHFKAEDMPETMPDYPGVWDGHSTPEKYGRLRDLLAKHQPHELAPALAVECPSCGSPAGRCCIGRPIGSEHDTRRKWAGLMAEEDGAGVTPE